jgi:hypothetical protein
MGHKTTVALGLADELVDDLLIVEVLSALLGVGREGKGLARVWRIGRRASGPTDPAGPPGQMPDARCSRGRRPACVPSHRSAVIARMNRVQAGGGLRWWGGWAAGGASKRGAQPRSSRTEGGLAVWRLHVHGADIPGRWVIIDQRFVPVENAPAGSRAGLRQGEPAASGDG